MENKKNYIDGVDVSGCDFYIQDYQRANNIEGRYEHCKDVCELNGDNYFYCKMNKDCYYKQLQRLKEELRTEKIYSSQIEELEESLQHAKAENDRLKQEWRLDCLKCEYKNTKADVDKYKQALQDIREIVSKIIDSYIRPYGDFDQLKNILAKINEVIGAE